MEVPLSHPSEMVASSGSRHHPPLRGFAPGCSFLSVASPPPPPPSMVLTLWMVLPLLLDLGTLGPNSSFSPQCKSTHPFRLLLFVFNKQRAHRRPKPRALCIGWKGLSSVFGRSKNWPKLRKEHKWKVQGAKRRGRKEGRGGI